jgi:hypothetical protein
MRRPSEYRIEDGADEGYSADNVNGRDGANSRYGSIEAYPEALGGGSRGAGGHLDNLESWSY